MVRYYGYGITIRHFSSTGNHHFNVKANSLDLWVATRAIVSSFTVASSHSDSYALFFLVMCSTYLGATLAFGQYFCYCLHIKRIHV